MIGDGTDDRKTDGYTSQMIWGVLDSCPTCLRASAIRGDRRTVGVECNDAMPYDGTSVRSTYRYVPSIRFVSNSMRCVRKSSDEVFFRIDNKAAGQMRHDAWFSFITPIHIIRGRSSRTLSRGQKFLIFPTNRGLMATGYHCIL